MRRIMATGPATVRPAMRKRLRQRYTPPRAVALIVMAMLLPWPATGEPPAEDRYERERLALVRDIEAHVQRTSDYLGRATLSARTIVALEQTPRHEFVPEALRDFAYADRPLPIGHDQTISQPYIVAIMTDLLDLEPGCTVLDVGTGSGYQAAVLARLCAHVYTIEIVEPLGRSARSRLTRLGYDNVAVRIGDGFDGWADHAPFDGIIVAAVAEEIPPPLLDQLKPGGRVIMPVGNRAGHQDLIVVERRIDGSLAETIVLPVRFVPLIRDEE